MDIVEELKCVDNYLAKEAVDMIEDLRKQVKFESECRNGAYADVEIQNAKIERLRKILSIVLEACEDVNSPDRKVREEITKTVRKALKEKA